MPILELPPNPARLRDPNGDNPDAPADSSAIPPLKARTGRFGELEEHEIIHLLGAIDDELARASFRESVYLSTIFCLALAWFIFYGPRVLFHQPEYKDLISAMKEHDKQITYLDMPHTVAPRPPTHAIPDRKTLQQLQEQPRTTPTAPAQPQAPPPPQEQAHTTAPPVTQPQLALPSAPRPAPPLVDAPSTKIAPNSSNAHDDMQALIRGARPGQGGQYASSPGPHGPSQPDAEILSDTMGVDFSAYMRRLHNDIQRNWDPLIPEEAQPPLLKKGITGIRFTILPDGKIGSMILETPSGDRALDEAAWHGITSEGNFPPLPREFHGPQLELRVHFFYNIPIQ